jgi:FlaA1/EpsC-like NDP-sugar epimerase
VLVEYAALLRRIVILSDVAVLAGSFFVAYVVRDWISQAGVQPVSSLESQMWLLALVLVIWLACLSAFGIYRSFRYQHYTDPLRRLARAHLVGALILLSLAFVGRRWEISRLLVHLFLVTSFAGLAVKQTGPQLRAPAPPARGLQFPAGADRGRDGSGGALHRVPA